MLDAITATQVAMLQDQVRLQSISQNVSNMQTPGYQRQWVDGLNFDEQIQAQMMTVSEQMSLSNDHKQGTLTQSRQATDLALTGNGYFEVQTDKGVFYTRRGDCHINEHGELTTATGAGFLGQNGIIRVDDNAFRIDANGAVLIDNHKVDKLSIMTFKHPEQLRYLGQGLYETIETPTPIDNNTHVLQGSLEQSNVKSIDEMMSMLTTSRHFEASQRVMRTADSLLATAINQLGESNV